MSTQKRKTRRHRRLSVERFEQRALLTTLVNAEIQQVTPSIAQQFGSQWSYLDDGSDQGTAWKDVGFDDSAWATGLGPFGYDCDVRLAHETTTIDSGDDDAPRITSYFRSHFQLGDVSNISELRFRMLRDDGVALYLNGHEVFRDGLAPNATSSAYATQVILGHGDGEEGEYTPVDFTIDVSTLPPGALTNGVNTLAAEVHDSDPTGNPCRDLVFDLHTTLLSRKLRLIADFDESLDLSSVQAHDLLVANTPAQNFEIVDDDTIMFELPQLSPGVHDVAIAEDAILDVLGNGNEVFLDSIEIAEPQYFVKNHPRLQLGDAPLTGYAGSETDQVEILWQTIPGGPGTNDNFQVDYRPSGSDTWTASPFISTNDVDHDGRIIHSNVLSGLSFDSSYEYRVVHSRGDVIVATYSADFATRLAPGDASSFTFVAYGDSADYVEIQNFRRVQDRINQLDPAFAVLVGDADQRGAGFDDLDYRFDPVLNPQAAEWSRHKIDYIAFGNHDIATDDGFPTEANYSVPIPVEGVNAPAQPDENERTEHNYSFDYGAVHFGVIDTNSYRFPERLSKQIDYLVADFEASDAKWKIAVGHHPVGGTPSFSQSPQMTYYQELVPRLRAAGVDLFLVGHSHTYSWTYPLTGENAGEATYVLDEDQDYAKGDGIVQVVSGVGGFFTLNHVASPTIQFWPEPNDYSVFPFVARGYEVGLKDVPVTEYVSEYGFAQIDVSEEELVVSYVAADDGNVIDSFKITAGPSTFSVNTVDDTTDSNPGDGVCLDEHQRCSLRAAIQEANATPELQAINFQFDGEGVAVIQPLSPLPAIVHPVHIDGREQDNVPGVEIRGDLTSGDGLTVAADGTQVNGVVINRFTGNGIVINSDQVTVDGSFIGTDATGLLAAPNGEAGILIAGGADHRIGTHMGNLVSANLQHGISILGNAQNIHIHGNKIGTDRSGKQALGNGIHGILIQDSTNNRIGGVEPHQLNLISANLGSGIVVSGLSGTENTIQGNYIGTDFAGINRLENGGDGIFIEQASLNLIGGEEINEGNLIKVNGEHTHIIAPPGNTIAGNYFEQTGLLQRELVVTDGTIEGTQVINLAGVTDSNPQNLFQFGEQVLFTATKVDGQVELFVTDGTQSGTRLLKDLSGSISSEPRDLVQVGEEVFFTAIVPSGQRELFKTDGSADGTILVRDLATNWSQPISRSSDPLELTPLGETVYFSAFQTSGKRELYRSNGYYEETKRAANVNGSGASSDPKNLVALGDKLLFAATGVDGQIELYESEGTQATTRLLKDLSGSVSSNPSELTVVGDTVFFTATQGNWERELYKHENGSTRRVLNLYPGYSSNPSDLIAVDGLLYFTADSPDGQRELYKSDGTANGTKRVLDISGPVSSSPSQLTLVGNTLFFTATQGNGEVELFKTTATSVSRVVNLYPGFSSNPSNLTASGDIVYFSATAPNGQTELYRSDGTAAGTQLVIDIDLVVSLDPSHLTLLGGSDSTIVMNGVVSASSVPLSPSNAVADASNAEAVDFLFAALDVDQSGSVMPSDALMIINAVDNASRLEPRNESASESNDKLDVNKDGRVSPADALEVINWISENSSRARREATQLMDDSIQQLTESDEDLFTETLVEGLLF